MSLRKTLFEADHWTWSKTTTSTKVWSYFPKSGPAKKGSLSVETVAEFLKIEHNMQEDEDGNIDTAMW